MRLIIATTNKGKLREYRDLLGGAAIEVKGLDLFQGIPEPIEDGQTFDQNAAIKARAYAIGTNEWVLADDSGLEVSAIGGGPGVHSARFGGTDAGYPERIALLLQKLEGTTDRSARFVCSVAVARPDGSIAATACGVCRGSIADSPRGSNGFGYDPVFTPEGHDRTFGEMRDEEKSALSHRARAANEIMRKMLDFIGV